jgi:hypothetical protein
MFQRKDLKLITVVMQAQKCELRFTEVIEITLWAIERLNSIVERYKELTKR